MFSASTGKRNGKANTAEKQKVTAARNSKRERQHYSGQKRDINIGKELRGIKLK